MKKIVPVFFLFLFLQISSASQVNFSASYQEYNQRLGLVILKKDAGISGSDFRIYAQNLQYNLQTGEIYARGEVKLFRDQEVLDADSLLYNVKTREGKVEEFKSVMQETFIQGQSAVLLPNYMKLSGGCATTCDHSHHHYRIEAKSMVLIPGKRLYLKNASFWLGNKKILSMPAYRFNLTSSGVQGPFLFVPGYDQSRGVYAQTRMDLYINKDISGELHLTPSSRRGTDFDLHLDSGMDGRTPASLDINRTRDVYSKTDSSRIRFHQGLDDQHYGNASLDLNWLEDDYQWSSKNKEMDWRLDWTRPLSFGWNAQLQMDGREDPDKDSYPGDNQIRSIHKKPAIKLLSPTRRISDSRYQFHYATEFTDLREHLPGFRTEASLSELNVNLYQDTIQTQKSTLSMNAQGRAGFYSTGDDRRYLRLNFGWKQNIGQGFSSDFHVNWHEVAGKSPFRSWDLLQDSEQFTQRINYVRGRFSSTLFQAGYENISKKWSSLSSFFRYRHYWKAYSLDLSARLVYSLYDQKDLGTMRLDSVFLDSNLYSAEDWEHGIRAQYSFTNSRFESFSHESRFLLNSKTFLSFKDHYNAITSDFTRTELGIIRDLHCFEWRLDWDFQQEEFKFEVYLKQGKNTGLGLRFDYEKGLSVRPDLPGIDEGL